MTPGEVMRRFDANGSLRCTDHDQLSVRQAGGIVPS